MQYDSKYRCLNNGYSYHELFFFYLKALTLFSKAFDLLMLGSFLTHLLLFLRNFWLTALSEPYFSLFGFLIPF